jgi:hypothetical protein
MASGRLLDIVEYEILQLTEVGIRVLVLRAQIEFCTRFCINFHSNVGGFNFSRVWLHEPFIGWCQASADFGIYTNY